MRVAVADEAEARAAIRACERILPVAGGSKPALSTAPAGTTVLDLSALSGVVDYEPGELTLTARAGTPLAAIESLLGEHRQGLAFDPPLVAAGATIGGAVAAATSGPGAFGPGGVRDFVIGIRVIDGEGRAFRGGGRVVKNAAGFDLPKLMVGSAGRLGAITEVTIKVFPLPAASATVVFSPRSLDESLAALAALARGPVSLEALELEPPSRLIARIGGEPEPLEARARRLAAALDAPAERLDPAAAEELWVRRARFGWVPPGGLAARVPITAADVPGLDAALDSAGATRIYSLGANLAWVGLADREAAPRLATLLAGRGLAGMPLLGAASAPSLGVDGGAGAFAARVRRTLDPAQRFAVAV